MSINASRLGEQVVVLLPVLAADTDLAGDDLSAVVTATAQLETSCLVSDTIMVVDAALGFAAAALAQAPVILPDRMRVL